MDSKRISLFMGHYGSGKTFVAVNYAVYLRKQNLPVDIHDLDIVNPYFRTIDALNFLKKNDINLIVSPYAETNVDIPAMNSASYKMISDKNSYAVVDVGGDDRGALALGRFTQQIQEENNYECFFVVNKFRPETRDIEGALTIKNEIEKSGRIKFTAIINNSNLANETTDEIILEGEDFVKKLCCETGLPLKFTSINGELINDNLKNKIKNILPVIPIKYGNWL